MNFRDLFTPIAWLTLVATGYAQSTDIASIIQRAQSRSRSVQAAEFVLAARQAALSGSKSTPSPTLELSPGVGYTNGNAVISQDIDLFGRRRSAGRVAQAEVQLATIAVARSRTEVAEHVLTNLAHLLAARDELAAATAALQSARSLKSAVAKRHEIGEAPRVHVTRAELDEMRAAQQLTLAEGRLKSSEAAMQSLVGPEDAVVASAWPKASGDSEARSFELLEASKDVALAEARANATQSDYQPLFSAGLAADVWSLNRNAMRRENLGLQVSLRMPLFASGQKRGALKAAKNQIASAQARVHEARRVAELALTTAQIAVKSAVLVVGSFETGLLPKGEAMLTAMREGYASGLVTLIEVLEAQQALTRLRQERSQAEQSLRLAEISLWRAQLTLPGTELPR